MAKRPVFGTREWAKYSANVCNGCFNNCRYCLGLDTSIMMWDGSLKTIKEIVIGDKIVGVLEKSTGFQTFVETKVLNHWFVEKDAVEVILKNGIRTVCSYDHKWLTKGRGWKHTCNTAIGQTDRAHLTNKSIIFGMPVENTPAESVNYRKGYLSGVIKGDALLKRFSYSRGKGIEHQYQFRLVAKDSEMVLRTQDYLMDFDIDVNEFLFPMLVRNTHLIENFFSIRTHKKSNFHAIKKLSHINRVSAEFCRGFLAGIFDAEGGNSSALRIFNTDKSILDKITTSLDMFKFKYVVETSGACPAVRLLGGLKEEVRFVQFTNPAIIRKRQATFLAKFIKGNDDGFTVKSVNNIGKRILCDITTGTENFIANGLVSHNCYAKATAIKRGQKTIKNWKEEVIFSKAPDKKWKLKDGTIMFPTVHDITPGNIDACVKTLHNMLEPGNNLLIVSKPRKECIKRLCSELAQYKDNILFRFTIGSANDWVLKLWEPNAPNFEERLESLIHAFKNDFNTSISCEPMLDGNIDHVIEQVRPFITDAIWLGKMNYPEKRLMVNGHADMIPYATRLMEIWNDDNIEALYERYKEDPIVKWKESIKQVVGIEIPTEAGLDK